ncbi:DUF2249 domain-containing protein [Pontibacter liquoris]|uniref:DUF2249 domain-containing protein n=1 Tax=Pontibacter liquoris TaxID=2905677 RepID=UPI001FA7E8EE|nr:DUF2249 domain-containing protein [Pontibacter liquoris]
MNLAATTKIAAILKANPAALEAIAGISSHFEKLRNPLLRKLLASRVSIADAARIGGCQVEDFYRELAPLGFTVAKSAATENTETAPSAATVQKPAFLQELAPDQLLVLDVRQQIAGGSDPFRLIMDAVNTLPATGTLLLINTFEPTPLLAILEKKGFRHFVEILGPDLVHTYFWKDTALVAPAPELTTTETEGATFEELLTAYAGKIRSVDVRGLEMPQPMVTILQRLAQLPDREALYVHHKRVPQFLLPQLQERGFAVSIKDAGAGDVYLLIYKK